MKAPCKIAILALAASAMAAAPVAAATSAEDESAIGFALLGGSAVVFALSQLLSDNNNDRPVSI